MKIVLAPDSFKGSLFAPQVCEALALGIKRVMPDAQIISCPMADGGEGTLDALLTSVAGAKRVSVTLPGASAQPLNADYALMPDGSAVIEVAQIIGITDECAMRTDVASRHTVGVGVLLRRLIEQGIRQFKIGLGGSSTNDGGAGLLVGLGARLYDSVGNIVAPTPVTLSRVTRIDLLDAVEKVRDVGITLLCDVDNPLLGPNGASAIFGPQKGILPVDIAGNDTALRNYAQTLEQALSKDTSIREANGAGAAGGLGYTLQMLGATMQSGAQMIAQISGLHGALIDADWVITGEGRSDAQTLHGKAPAIVANLAKTIAPNAKRSLISGAVDLTAIDELSVLFNGGCFSLTNRPMSLADAITESADLLAYCASQCSLLLSKK